MPNKTTISWCTMTTNPFQAWFEGRRGWYCEKPSEGCDNCYAEALNRRYWTGLEYHRRYRDSVLWVLNHDELKHIRRLKKPQIIFWHDVYDVFQPSLTKATNDIFDCLSIVRLTPQHLHLWLTKYPQNAVRLLRRYWGDTSPTNFWLGVSVENLFWAKARIPLLLDCPAGGHFVSYEPALEYVDFTPWRDRLDAIIVGGESGPGARPCPAFHCYSCALKLEGTHSLGTDEHSPEEGIEIVVQRLLETGIPLHVKQLGTAWAKAHGYKSKGDNPKLWPSSLQGDPRLRAWPASWLSKQKLEVQYAGSQM